MSQSEAAARRIDLEPRDWLWATWRPRPHLPTPEPIETAPFNLDRSLKLLRRKALKNDADALINWELLTLPKDLSRQAAHFWFMALTAPVTGLTLDQFVDSLDDQTYGGNLSREQVAERLRTRHQHRLPEAELIRRLLPIVLPPLELAQLALIPEPCFDALSWWNHVGAASLTPEECATLRDQIRSRITPQHWPDSVNCKPPFEFYLAARLGLQDELLAVVERWPDNAYPQESDDDLCQQPQYLVFGLGSTALVEKHFRRLKLKLNNTDHVRAWIANTEYAGLNFVRDAILAAPYKPAVEESLEVFCRVKAPEAAPYMLDLMLRCSVPGPAKQWLEEQPQHAIAGLLPVALEQGKFAESALAFLREEKRKGHGDLIEDHLRHAPADAAERIRKLVLDQAGMMYTPLDDRTTPDWLRDAIRGKKKAKMPDWLVRGTLPVIPLEGNTCLNDEQVQMLLAALGRPFDIPEPLFIGLKKHADRLALDEFVWKLFELWLAERSPTPDRWAMKALGHLGGDAIALKLAPLIRNWPGENQHKRAAHGLECLCAIGTDTALMQLSSIAAKVRYRKLQNQAREMMKAIAFALGLGRDELEDRIVPDLELDEQGRRVLDFGHRKFTVVLGPDLTPQLLDEAGKQRKDLPKPGKSDDADKARASVGVWKLLKRQLKETAKVQAGRLEQAMVRGRRWTVERFERLLVRHPLMTNLVKRLLWQAHNAVGQLEAVFRVTEERDYANSKDAAISLSAAVQVGMVHPLQLSESERKAWGEIFGDYELVSPFPQLGRPVHRLLPGEETKIEIDRFKTANIPGVVVWSQLEKAGWERGNPGGYTHMRRHMKHFPSVDVTAVIEYEPGLSLEDIASTESQSLSACFIAGPGNGGPPPRAGLLPLGQIDGVMLSEVLMDLYSLAAKGQ
jgi:hypothetical protein